MKKVKTLISFLLCLIFLLCLCSSAFAATTIQIKDYQLESVDSTHYSIYKYTGDSKDLVLMNSYTTKYISEIGSTAFYANTDISKVTFNKDLKVVRSDAFCGSSVYEVVCNKNLTTIGSTAFQDCQSLHRITIEKSTTSIANDAFDNSPNVTIYCYKDSTAHQYAVEQNIPYVLLDGENNYIVGDADGDGEVSIYDALIIQKVLARLTEDTDGKIAERGNIDGVGDLAITDASSIQRYLASFGDKNDIGELRAYKE